MANQRSQKRLFLEAAIDQTASTITSDTHLTDKAQKHSYHLFFQYQVIHGRYLHSSTTPITTQHSALSTQHSASIPPNSKKKTFLPSGCLPASSPATICCMSIDIFHVFASRHISKTLIITIPQQEQHSYIVNHYLAMYHVRTSTTISNQSANILPVYVILCPFERDCIQLSIPVSDTAMTVPMSCFVSVLASLEAFIISTEVVFCSTLVPPNLIWLRLLATSLRLPHPPKPSILRYPQRPIPARRSAGHLRYRYGGRHVNSRQHLSAS